MRARSDTRIVGAFTIVELLVAAAVTAVIVVMLGVMFNSLIANTSRAKQRVDAFSEARAALQLIARDLGHLVLPPANGSRSAAYFAINNDTSNTSGSYARHIYALFSTNGSSATGGDMASVGYYCGWDTSVNCYKLYRFYRNSAATYGLLSANCTASGTLTYVGIDKLYPVSAQTDDVLAGNCWNMIVTAFDSAGNVINPQTYFTTSTTTTAPYICDPPATVTSANPLPAAIEISFKAMSASAARTVIATGAGPTVWMAEDEDGASQQDKEAYVRLIKPHVYQFRTRIKLR